jgi:hypothetical protein
VRTLPEAQFVALLCEAGSAAFARVRVLRAGVWYNLSALFEAELDFLEEVEVSEAVDAPVGSATVSLQRELHGFSLAPLVTTSPANVVGGAWAPLLAEGRVFVVEAAVLPLGSSPVDADWLELFRGRIDEIDAGGDGLTFAGRDYGGGLLQDTFIERERPYGSDAGVDVERVMAQLLSDNLSLGYARWQASHAYHDSDRVLPTAGKASGFVFIGDALAGSSASSGSTEPATWPVTAGASVADGGMLWYAEAPHLLYTPTTPSWVLGRYTQKCEPLQDALAALARQLGWEVRYKWRSSASAFVLTFWTPDRAATIPDWYYGPKEYAELGQVRTSLEDVRNAVEVVYSDSADLDVAGNPKRKTVSVEDSASIAALGGEGSGGRRFMRVAEAATSNINTSSEATALANAALADLKEVFLGVEVEVPFHPGLELGDVVQLTGNGVHFTAAQSAAVRALTHSFTAGSCSTKLTLLGKPSTSVRVWLGMEQRPATAPASPFTGPSAPTGLSSATTAGGFRLRFSPPITGPKATAYELHISTSSGFTPSDATRRVVGDVTEVTVTDLLPGTTYYAVVVARDVKGNRGVVSAEETLVPRYVEPRALQPRITWGSLPLNGDVEATSDASKPPDAWTLNTAWGTNALLTTDVLSGKAAVLFPNIATTATLTAQPFTVREGEVWVFSAFYKQSTGSTASGVLAFTYLDASLAAISSVSVSLGASAAANTWTRAAQKVVIPAGARFGEISFSRSGSFSGTLTVDSVDALRGAAFEAWRLPSYENGWTDANTGIYGQVRYRRNDLGEVEVRGVALSSTPAPGANTNVFTLPAAYAPDAVRLWRLVTSGGVGLDFTIDSLGRARVNSIAAGVNISLDGIRFFVD